MSWWPSENAWRRPDDPGTDIRTAQAHRSGPPPGCSAFLSQDLEAAGEPRRPGYGPGGEQPLAAARSGSGPLWADARIAVRVLARLRRDHGRRPRRDARHRVAGAGLRRRAPR